MTKLYVMSFRIQAGKYKSVTSCPEHFRPYKIRTSVETVGDYTIDEIIVNKTNMLLERVDAYYWSLKHTNRIMGCNTLELEHQFYKEHNLIGKSSDEIQDYLDENELSVPGPARLMFPTIPRNTPIEIHGEAKTDFAIMLIGHVGY